ncbi:transcriptional repressor [Mycolicibacterium sp. P1-18]|uniref:Fur family transcriptional regulator n=1 Tax=Mycolicibacterium sp. P1-18 TaxID=2024615 RepID=UPI0011F2C069|nr:Fur family transcriptional regulator [Mycolicibacterium sp. P1-18]KAA0099794.1 transcriptional repressor [Mycolicibacterium sp. P1-18]
MVASTRDTEELLRNASLRVTAQRSAVLHVLEHHPHIDVRSLKTLVINHIGSVSTQTLYDVVSALIGAGLVRRIGSAGSASLFELEGGDNHHHVVCRRCGALEDVDCVSGEAPCLTPQTTKGFVVDEAEVTFWGTCTSCSDTVDGAQAPSPRKENM